MKGTPGRGAVGQESVVGKGTANEGALLRGVAILFLSEMNLCKGDPQI